MTGLRALRLSALAIAIAGVLDPAITSDRPERPEVALVTAPDLPDPGLADRVARALDGRFTVVRGPSLSAAATVVVGRQLPQSAANLAGSAFAVRPDDRVPSIAIEAVDRPARAQVESSVPIAVRVRADAARGRTLAVTLSSGGVALDRATRTIDADAFIARIGLGFVAVGAGVTPLIVTASIDGVAGDARADVAIDVQHRRWAVLVMDRRPSWMSTFVRRALEADPRFEVTSRIATSRGASADAGAPPPDLSSLPRLARFDAIVVGAAEELTATDVKGLEVFLRQRGGGVVLLLDQPSEARPFMSLVGVPSWRLAERAQPEGRPPASAYFSPAALPPGAVPLGDHLWRLPVGAGRVLVNGALDAWRYRDRDSGAFDSHWRLAIAELADATPAPFSVSLDAEVLAPGGSTRLREWPSGDTTRVRAPLQPGRVPIAVARNGLRAETTLLVVDGARHPAPDEGALVEAWAASRGGAVISESNLAQLPPAIEDAVAPVSRPVTWHPMRSAWWLLPFAGMLGVEWWTRRRRGWR